MAPDSSPNVTPLVLSRTGTAPRIMVHVVAYNASTTLSQVLDRIPLELRPRL